MRLPIILSAAILISALGLSAAEPKEKAKYRVTCTECESVVTLPATKCLPSGAWTVEGGNIVECTLYFKCPVCKKRFTARHKEFKKTIPDAEVVKPKPSAVPSMPPLPPAVKRTRTPATPPKQVPAIWQKEQK